MNYDVFFHGDDGEFKRLKGVSTFTKTLAPGEPAVEPTSLHLELRSHDGQTVIPCVPVVCNEP